MRDLRLVGVQLSAGALACGSADCGPGGPARARRSRASTRFPIHPQQPSDGPDGGAPQALADDLVADPFVHAGTCSLTRDRGPARATEGASRASLRNAGRGCSRSSASVPRGLRASARPPSGPAARAAAPGVATPGCRSRSAAGSRDGEHVPFGLRSSASRGCRGCMSCWLRAGARQQRSTTPSARARERLAPNDREQRRLGCPAATAPVAARTWDRATPPAAPLAPAARAFRSAPAGGRPSSCAGPAGRPLPPASARPRAPAHGRSTLLPVRAVRPLARFNP